ncbi:hypothetical protein FRC06_008639 [Ceratobasidium sp. 370]|nr:hypothetical protein FRC06_008639 [Ceratobasidium sp. 370]
MVTLTPRFASLLVFVVSSSMVMSGVDALPQARQVYVKPRDHRHHHHHHHHHGHHGHHGHHPHHDSGRTKVYADDPLVVSGDGNHIHAHLNKRHHGHHHHGDHHHDGHHETKVYADDPLVVSGNGNHIHSHSHKRGILDPLIPLLGAVPGVPGIIDLVNMVSHAILNEKLASLIISSKSDDGTRSITGDNSTSGFVISASNSSSTVMYLLPQSISISLAPSEQPVLITMPMFNGTEKGVKMYCASYDPSPSGPVQISSEPCMTNATAPPNGNALLQTSQLFSWNTQSGEITPLWHKDATQPLVDTTSAPGGAPDPASQDKGFMVGQSAPCTSDGKAPSGTIAMVFRAIEPHSKDSTMDSMAKSENDSPSSTASAQETSTVVALEASTEVLSATETPSAAAVGATPSSTTSSTVP